MDDESVLDEEKKINVMEECHHVEINIDYQRISKTEMNYY